ncbi:hypothetical protein H7J71_08470 [Mycolicibacterium peregrinum]|uniref:hypothetical protein n=1 Tax=Mycolicibacterium peregrinum TaxID=43304 RepID=UPI0006D823E3|nr:hypothetical protein [Mycolicibacterium peregrinum]MCV7202049.1 hypothetical protein [Mycolicibacterium peregrinum]ORW61315.1 hypothetical protein AWC21_08405 [Mycolicibacterium peregrinum]
MATLTLQDVADLAKVRRPVVSMWRKRPVVRGVSLPFPDPVETVNGVARFDRAEVVEWLARTGRGKNDEHRYDAPAVAVPDGVALEDIVTLLCWHVLTGDDLAGTSRATRVRRADEVDPEDTLLAGEIRRLRPSDAVLRYVDDLVEASRGPGDALARLETSRLKRELALRELTDVAVDVLRCLVEAAAIHLEHDGVVLHVEDSAVALDVAEACGLDIASNDRKLRRRAVIRGVYLSESATGSRVSALSLVGLDVPDALDRLDEMVLGLSEGDVAVIIGSAAALADNLAGAPQKRRADALRVDNLVAAMRLPRGLWREAHRQALAVWVCLGGANAGMVQVADLSAVGSIELTDVAADAVGALAQTDVRAYRYARDMASSTMRAGGPVVPRGVRAVKVSDTGIRRYLDEVYGTTLVTTTPLEPLDILVQPGQTNIQLQHRSLGELYTLKRLVIKRGRRIDPGDASPEGTVRVLPAELVGTILLDPFEADRKYSRAARTEPGDVIFVEKPRPRAWVDHRGGAVVASPARIMRLRDSAAVGPLLLATIINERVVPGSEWKTWSVPVLSRAETVLLETALGRAAEYEHQVRRRVDAARELKLALIDGVAAGALTLDAPPTTPGVAAASR